MEEDVMELKHLSKKQGRDQFHLEMSSDADMVH